MRYYDNMRLVYEIESRVRDLRRAATPDNTQDMQQQQQQQEAPAAAPTPKNPSKSESRQPNRDHRTYGRDEGGPELAAVPTVLFAVIPQARHRDPQQTPPLSLLGCEHGRTA